MTGETSEDHERDQLETALAKTKGELSEVTGDVLEAVRQLGSIRLPEAADALLSIDSDRFPKNIRKEARRQLQRLRSLGVRPIATRQTPVVEPGGVFAILASNYDGGLNRLIQIYDKGKYSGIHVTSVLINAFVGVQEVFRREIGAAAHSEIEDMLDGGETSEKLGVYWRTITPEYAKYLLHQATSINATVRSSVPADYVFVTELLRDAVALGEPPIRGHIRAVEAMLDPSLLEASVALFDEPEMRGWSLDPEFMDLVRQRLSAINERVPGPFEGRKTELLNQTLAEAYETMFIESTRRAYRRALTETAWIFWQDGRQLAARRAIAVAEALTEPEVNPFTHRLLMRSLFLEGYAAPDAGPEDTPASGLWTPS